MILTTATAAATMVLTPATLTATAVSDGSSSYYAGCTSHRLTHTSSYRNASLTPTMTVMQRGRTVTIPATGSVTSYTSSHCGNVGRIVCCISDLPSNAPGTSSFNGYESSNITFTYMLRTSCYDRCDCCNTGSAVKTSIDSYHPATMISAPADYYSCPY